MRSIGNHRLQMGLADCAVQMMTAIDNHDRRASMFHHHPADDSYAPVKMPKICDGCRETVDQGNTVKGYDYEGETVILTQDDLAAVAKNSGNDIEVLRFVRAKQINPLLFSGEKVYWIVPDTDKKRSGKLTVPTYKAFLQVLVEEDKCAVVTYTKWGKTRIALLRVEPTENGGVLVLQNLLWADELREPAFPVLNQVKDTEVDPRLLPMMRMVVESMTEEWNPAEYVDVYEEQLSAAIAAKAAGNPVEVMQTAPTAVATDDIADLLAKLEASVKPKTDEAAAPAKKAPAKRAPRKAAAKKVVA
jgi:DNA end-binding protein Ku